ncbi:putative carbonic anhydrase 3 isoform X2 [Drosophila innubila]|uniref:putative carbonic anhydrase 3 isoform X2 n=1 Tax=Drosophila innubila TaxID=198719 RepID=UPI00148BE8C2|nr:putative carbonic anhydrase 3 isoform X2 [Drosophila innubila]
MHHVVRTFSKSSHFNYDKQGKDWNVKVGTEQSPISLEKEKAVWSVAPRLKFINYNKTLSGPLKLTNNGHTVTMVIPPVDDGNHPSVCGCKLDCIYKAVQLHFHWGSPKSKGSEHMINSSRYDAELHILHQNYAYALQNNAISSPDGFVALAIMLRSECPNETPGILDKLFVELNRVRDYNTTSTYEGPFCLRDILNGMERKEFFAYRGSLTTPPCTETVNWFVFPNPVDVSEKSLKNFWLLKDDRGLPLLNNYREIQSLHQRTVYYRNETANF